MRTFASFNHAHSSLTDEFRSRSYEIHPDRWQAVDVSKKPDMAMRELFSTSFQVPLRGLENLGHWQEDILPNLPFADVHFAERIGGEGTNPGEAWKIWPWGHSAAGHLTAGESNRFTHTYQERFWPTRLEDHNANPQGIRYRYGDYNDLVRTLREDPLTRQAYLPIWFPEDLACNGRKPCSLGYHLLMRHDYLHITYGIRSCDFVRHWRDDCYFTVRLLLETLSRLRAMDERWQSVKPGMFIMHIGSLHMFVNDFRKICV